VRTSGLRSSKQVVILSKKSKNAEKLATEAIKTSSQKAVTMIVKDWLVRKKMMRR